MTILRLIISYIASKFQGHWKQGRQLHGASNHKRHKFSLRFCYYKPDHPHYSLALFRRFICKCTTLAFSIELVGDLVTRICKNDLLTTAWCHPGWCIAVINGDYYSLKICTVLSGRASSLFFTTELIRKISESLCCQ